MKAFIKISIFGFLLTLLFSSCGEPNSFFQVAYKQKIKSGDNIKWAHKNFNDNLWTKDIDIETQEGIFWVRLKAEFPERVEPYRDQGVLLYATGAYEVFWDGVYLCQNGQLETENHKETPGIYPYYFLIPDSLQAFGKHTLALRTTQTMGYPSHQAVFYFGDYFDLLREPLQISKYMFMIAGVFLITAIYFFFVFANQPEKYSELIFGIICLIFFGLLLMEYLKFYHPYPYPFQYVRLEIIGACHLLICIFIPLFFMIQFSFPWKKYLMAIIFLTLFILEWQYHYSADWIAITIDKLVWLFSIIIVIYACYQKRKGAYIVLCGLLISLPIPSLLFSVQIPFVSAYDVSIFIIFFIIILSMLYVRTLKMRAEQKAYEASLVLSERLKNELLKKNIKPHFIMNTLTSLIDWVEESPKEGVKFIHALAGEFEVLNQIADYKQVPIGQEIKLCKSHLEVMSYRKEIAYKWEDKGIDPNDIIPPAIIHTAVENGVTHSLPDENGVITFRLVFEKNKTFKKYTLLTIAKNRTASASEKVKEVEGTGLKYIKARLQESYPDNWKINSKATDEGWETSIKIMEP